jgi:outer membrane protein
LRVDKILLIIIASLALGWGLGANDEPLKIGVVDLDQAVGATTEGKTARDELEKKQEKAQLELQPMVERYQELTNEYQTKRVVLSPDKLRTMELDITELQQRIEFKQNEVQSRMRLDFERLVGPLQTKLAKVVGDIGRENGFSLIIRRDGPGFMYTREALDITDLVIAKFDDE